MDGEGKQTVVGGIEILRGSGLRICVGRHGLGPIDSIRRRSDTYHYVDTSYQFSFNSSFVVLVVIVLHESPGNCRGSQPRSLVSTVTEEFVCQRAELLECRVKGLPDGTYSHTILNS